MDKLAKAAYDRERYRRSVDQTKARTAAWRQANLDRHLAHTKAWRLRNHEAVLAATTARNRRTRGPLRTPRTPEEQAQAHRLHQAQRRARKKSAAGSCSWSQWKDRLAYYGFRCWMCRGPWEEIDHVIPLSRGGSNWPSNLRPSCGLCNRRKGNRLPRELVFFG